MTVLTQFAIVGMLVFIVLLDFLLGKHLQHIHKCFDDAVFRLSIERYNETRLLAVGSHKFQLIFSLSLGNINYYYV